VVLSEKTMFFLKKILFFFEVILKEKANTMVRFYLEEK